MSNSVKAKARRTKRSHLTKYQKNEQLGTRRIIYESRAQRALTMIAKASTRELTNENLP